MFQLEFPFMQPKVNLETIMLDTARRDDIVLLNQSHYDEWDRLNRVDELAVIYKLPVQGIKDYCSLYRYLEKKENEPYYKNR